MQFQNLDISIKDYLGILQDGVSVILSIKLDNEIFESMYWYNENTNLIILDDELEFKIGAIQEKEYYADLILYLKETCPTFSEIKPNLQIIG